MIKGFIEVTSISTNNQDLCQINIKNIAWFKGDMIALNSGVVLRTKETYDEIKKKIEDDLW